MGKKSNAFIDQIDKQLNELNENLEKLNIWKEQNTKALDACVPLFALQVSTIHRYSEEGMKEKEIELLPEYARRAKELEAWDDTVVHIQDNWKKIRQAVEKDKQAVLATLAQFERYVTSKSKSWNPFVSKKSVPSSQAFIKDVRKLLEGIKFDERI
jgi:hypothetical protein